MTRQPQRHSPYGYSLCLGLISALALFLLSAFFSCQNPLSNLPSPALPTVPQHSDTQALEPTVVLPSFHSSPQPVPGADDSQPIQLLREDGSVETLSLAAYLWGVLAAEMPASFPLEALKAQAVAARSYTALRLANPKHSNAQVCDQSNCCQAYLDLPQRLESWGTDAPFYQEYLRQAVSETDGLYILYDNSPIDAVFFSSSSGQTLPALEVWGTALPYLQSVPSPEGEQVPQYLSVVQYTATEVQALLAEQYPQITLSSQPETWFTAVVTDSVGGVAQMNLGNSTLTGSQLRSLFQLRSTYFQLAYQEPLFTFSVTGYGHNVGMSQYGAKALAEEGKQFDQILSWYYSDCVVSSYPL